MKVLKARLYDLKMKEQQAKLEQLGGEKKDIAFGSQIRSYVLHPYQLVKDHRTKEEVGDVNRVLDGDHRGVSNEEGVGNAGAGGSRRRRGVVEGGRANARCMPARADRLGPPASRRGKRTLRGCLTMTAFG